MKKIITIVGVLLALNSFAQSERNYSWDWEYQKSKYNPIEYTPSKNVEQIEFAVTNKRGKTSTYFKNYNSEGKLIKYSKKNKAGKIIPIVEFEYNKDNQITVSKSFKKGEVYSTTTNTYNNFGKMVELKKVNSKNDVLLKNTWQYNADSNVTESARFKKNEKLNKKWEYAYYSNGEKSKTTLYNGKGKIKNVWTFDCKADGEKLEKKKNQTQICKWDESSKEHLIKVTQSFNEKGEIRKHVSKYTISDTLIVESASYDGDDKLVQKITYNKDYKFPLTNTTYKKGKARSETIYRYKNDQVVYYEHKWKSKSSVTVDYKYENDLLIMTTTKFKDGKIRNTISLKYGEMYSEK